MATTTTNFGWDIPQSTDLVKDGATAIAALGQDIDTAFVDLKGGTTGQVLSKASNTDLDFTWVAQDDSNAIQNAIVDAKGDLISATSADTPARLAVGTNGQVLTADSSTSTGLKWATPSSGSLTLIATATPSAVASFSFTSIPQTYKQIIVMGYLTPSANGDGANQLTFNSDTSSNYVSNAYSTGGSFQNYSTNLQLHNNMTNTAPMNIYIQFFNYTDSGLKQMDSKIVGPYYSNTAQLNTQYKGYQWAYKGSAITSITFNAVNGTYTGTLYLYGVS